MTDQRYVQDFRLHQRYIFDHPVKANYESLDVTVTNISAGGLQILHADPLRLKISSRILVPLARSAKTAELRGEVLWSHLSHSPYATGEYLYRSGVKLDKTQENALAVERLLQAYRARADGESLKRKREVLQRKQQSAAARSSLVMPDQTVQIRQVCERLKQSPEELKLLAQRGRSALSESATHADEVLAVWEYLQRTVSLEDIEQALARHPDA